MALQWLASAPYLRAVVLRTRSPQIPAELAGTTVVRAERTYICDNFSHYSRR
jgi:hypothetical protein